MKEYERGRLFDGRDPTLGPRVASTRLPCPLTRSNDDHLRF